MKNPLIPLAVICYFAGVASALVFGNQSKPEDRAEATSKVQEKDQRSISKADKKNDEAYLFLERVMEGI